MRKTVQEQILLELRQIRWQLNDMDRRLAQQLIPQSTVASESGLELLTLPDHLRRPYLIVRKYGECSASQVSLETGRHRSVESGNLNQLVRLGWLHKSRQLRTAMFRIVQRRPLLTASS